MERINFVFDGMLSSQHRMDFYESARFQYAASRLMVKLDSFRQTGVFPRKITYKNRSDILVLPTKAGSYGIETIIPIFQSISPAFLNVSIEALLSFVVDRVFKTADEDDIALALENNRAATEAFREISLSHDDVIRQTLEMLREQIESNRDLTQENRDIMQRLSSDNSRKLALFEQQNELRKITPDHEAELITMSSPLLKEMNVPLRRSARHLSIQIASNDNPPRYILFANKKMADAVQTERVDRHMSTIDVNIIQFNKENGWGKFESPQWEGRPSFSVPGEILDYMKATIMRAMREESVEVHCKFVRSSAGIPLRIILTDIRLIDEI